MEHMYPIGDLTIIGAMEVPVSTPPYQPQVLTPVFQLKATEEVLYPPYHLHDDCVVSAPTTRTLAQRDFAELVEENSALALPTPLPAQKSHLLWFDDKGQINYERRSTVQQRLAYLARTHLLRAEEHLQTQQWHDARDSAATAYSADPTKVDALVIQAVAEKNLGLSGQMAITTELAIELISRDSFSQLVHTHPANDASHRCRVFRQSATYRSMSIEVAAMI